MDLPTPPILDLAPDLAPKRAPSLNFDLAALRPAPQHTSALKTWFKSSARDLPWRRPPSRTPALTPSSSKWRRDPYATWIAESMLQQTQVDTVIRAYTEWMKAFPDLSRLAKASEDEVLALWSGLGYYRRARNLRQAAQMLVAAGRVNLPDSREELLAMPGVGAYTAGAILSLAFGQREPILDGNVIRVASRFHGLPFLPDHAEGKAVYWSLAKAWADDAEPWSVNEALMELGALICAPRAPRCSSCPLAADCRAHREKKTDVLPPAKARAEVVLTPAHAFLIEHRDKILLYRQAETGPEVGTKVGPQSGLLKGHWLFPMLWQKGNATQIQAFIASHLPAGAQFTFAQEAGHVSHTITHHKIEMLVHLVSVISLGRGRSRNPSHQESLQDSGQSRWVDLPEVPKTLVPSLGRKIWASYLGLAQQRKPITRLV